MTVDQFNTKMDNSKFVTGKQARLRFRHRVIFNRTTLKKRLFTYPRRFCSSRGCIRLARTNTPKSPACGSTNRCAASPMTDSEHATPRRRKRNILR